MTKFNNEFIAATLTEAVDIAATRLSQNFALNQIAEKGSCTLEEAENMYGLALRVLTEGSEDLIPENLELPDGATDDVDPTAAQDAAVDADVGAGEDLDLSDLEGIVLPDSEGNQYIIQGGILVPYEEDETDEQVTVPGSDDVVDGGEEALPADNADNADIVDDQDDKDDEDLEESSNVVDPNVSEITESSVFANNSSIVTNLLKNVNFGK